jgi:hypothetical protein
MSQEPEPDLFNTALMFKREGTSADAARAAALEARYNDTHRLIWRALKAKPRTADEIATDLKLVLNTARARMSELLKRGWIARTGERRATGAGRAADVLRAVEKAPAPQEPNLFGDAPENVVAVDFRPRVA